MVGFVTPTGKYIAPMFTGMETKVNEKFLGMFLGALVFFSNLCLVTAVVLREFQVSNIIKFNHFLVTSS